jgi:hypothetical protein
MRFARTKLVALLSTTAMLVLLTAAVPSASAQSGGWNPGPGGILDNTYDGFIDLPHNGDTIPSGGSFSVLGWFVDKTAQGWAGYDDAQVWLGTMDGGGKMLAKASIAQSRPDVGAAESSPFFNASGFSASVPGSSVPSGSQTLYVYIHTGGKGWWWKSVTVTGGGSGTGAAPMAPSTGPAAPAGGGAPVVKFLNPTPGQNVPTRSDYNVNGTVNDPTNVDRIEVWIEGERNSQSGVLIGTTTPNSDGSWSISFRPTRFPSTHANMYAYAHNKATGLETEATVDINITDKSV